MTLVYERRVGFVSTTTARGEPDAATIDPLNDAAAIVAWPAPGSEPRILHVNAAFASLFGYRAPEMRGRTIELFYGPLTDRERVDVVRERVRAGRDVRLPAVFYRSDGVPMWVELSSRGVPPAAPAAEPVSVMTFRDATARKEFEVALAQEKRKLQVTLAAIGDAVITTVADGRIDSLNLAARTLLGIDASEAYGEPIADILALRGPDNERVDLLAGHAASGGIVRGQAACDDRPTLRHVAYVSSQIGDEGYVVVLRDVTVQHRISAQLSYEASHDPLTAVFNRRKFDAVLDETIEAARRDGVAHALAFLDLDRFKLINDRCGHAVGDRVLAGLAQLLAQQLRERDTLARIGGDEFALLLYDCSLENARRVAEKIRQSVEAYRIVDRDIAYGVGVSIGIAAIDGSEIDARAILARADAACYAAKARGRNAIAG